MANMPRKTSHPLAVKFPACGVCVLESHHEDDFRMAWAAHDFLKVLYVLEGRGRLLLEGGGSGPALREGALAVVPEGTRHRIADEAGRALSLLVLCVRSDVLQPYREEGGKDVCRATMQAVLSRMGRELLRDMLYEQTMRQVGSEAMCVARTLELWTAWQRSRGGRTATPRTAKRGQSSQRRVAEYVAALAGSFYQQETLEEAAGSTELSVRRFTQLFREATGRSWREEVRRRQIVHARHLLRTTRRSVAAVCFECGFSDLSTFYRAFKAAEGESPQRWRG